MTISPNALLPALFSLVLASHAFAASGQRSIGAADSAAGATGAPGSSQPDNAGRLDERIWERQHRASRIIGTDVYDLQGKKIGEVRDMVLDPKLGNIEYAVVSFGGIMGVGSKYFAVPWKSLQATSDARRYMLNVDKDAVQSAPAFDKNRWPDMANQQWRSAVERYWQDRSATAASSGGAESGHGAAGPAKLRK